METNHNEWTTLSGKTALVTGGTKGIGLAIAQRLSKAGAQVIVSARTQPTDGDPAHHFIAADLTKADDVAQLATKINEQYGGIDVLINNVGGLTTPPGGHGVLTDALWEQELQLNLISAIRLDRTLLPQMVQKKNGVIVHISSVAGKQALWNLNMAYAVSKSALNAYSKALATELATQGIRVVTVAPGATKTPMMEGFIREFATSQGLSYDEGYTQLLTQIGGIPMGRMAEPDEVAALVHFLVSPSAQYLTGSIYAIDGGSLPVVS